MTGVIVHCDYCAGIAETAIQIRTGVWHEAQDQRDTSRIEVVHLCGKHWNEVERLLTRLRIAAA